MKSCTLEPGGLFTTKDFEEGVQTLDTAITDMSACSLNYWLSKFVQEVSNSSGERYFEKFPHSPNFMEEQGSRHHKDIDYLMHLQLDTLFWQNMPNAVMIKKMIKNNVLNKYLSRRHERAWENVMEYWRSIDLRIHAIFYIFVATILWKNKTHVIIKTFFFISCLNEGSLKCIHFILAKYAERCDD